MREVDFSKKTVRKQWELVNTVCRTIEQEGEADQVLLEMIRVVMELGMDLKRYERIMNFRAEGRWNKANGYYYRHIDTSFGAIERLKVPRLRRNQQPYRWFEHYQRRWKKVDRLLLSCFIGGLSTRKAVKIMNRCFHWGMSPSLITKLGAGLQETLQKYRTCHISDEYIGLIVDGAWYRFRQLYGPERVLLAVLGVKADGHVVLLGFHVAKSESQMEVSRILLDLKNRGLTGLNLEIFVADGSGGIEAAASEVYPWARFQLCCWHHLQILKNHASCAIEGRKLMREAAQCYWAGNLQAIQTRLADFMNKWRSTESRAISLFRRNVAKTLTYLSLPIHMHRWFRTTNFIERLFRDIRSRTKLIGSFDQPVHLENLLIGIVAEVSWISLPVCLQPLLAKDTLI